MARRHVPARPLNASGDDTQRSLVSFWSQFIRRRHLYVKLCEIAALKGLRKRWKKD